MALPLTLLPPITLGGSQPVKASLASNFGTLLGQAVQGLEQGQSSANQTIQQAMAGNVSVTQAMVAMTEAQSALDVATSVQNQAISAYQSIINMPLS
ncbi:flagellar hook-basal body complex protein FliE [Sulfobacillus harzensis]|uniref:Flagellar hook-basal body complex protein FliE n=1 Tax=Sulfobacillus harzensis TaxID=2729629 RepID=A0A7Y0L6B7_9FIRM|nr:flagellar hook-basal body complex protein FliE [Sulfobacillus harzensis]NMP23546.1 flagellar hook-basal body complex protein FliE [Sulfobacillus harzensis]